MLFDRSLSVQSRDRHLSNSITNALNPVVQPEWCFVFPYLFLLLLFSVKSGGEVMGWIWKSAAFIGLEMSCACQIEAMNPQKKYLFPPSSV